MAVGGVFAAIDRTSFVTRASSVAPPPPEKTERAEQSQLPYGPAPMPKAVLPPAPQRKAIAARPPGRAIYKCEDSNGAVTYTEFPCGEGTFVDTRPTSSGFSDNWSISVKRSER